MKFFSFLFIGILLTVASCKKLNPPNDNDEPKERVLPPATTSGENTFGCKVNGEVFLPNGNINYWGIDHPVYYVNYEELWIRVKNLYDYPNNIYLYIYIDDKLSSTGVTKELLSENYPQYEILHENYTATGYYIDSTKNYYVDITRLDLENRIVSGTFEYTVVNEELADTIKITEGRFDLNNLDVDNG